MVGLTPKTKILHVTNNGNPLLSEVSSFIELCKDANLDVVGLRSPENLSSEIANYKPTIVLIDENYYAADAASSDDNLGESFKAVLQDNPFKLILVDREDFQNKTIKYLRLGADEVILKGSSVEEVYFKCYSHIRRRDILELDQLTNLPGLNRSYNVIEHCRKNLSDWVLVHVDIFNIKSYSLMYGVAKGDTAIKITAEVIQKTIASLDIDDFFIGHLGRDNFVIIIHSDFQEIVTEEIKKNFVQVLKDLYIESDYENGYIICPGNGKVKRKEGLLSLSIGTVNHIDRHFLSGTDIIEQAIKNKKANRELNKRVLVLEEDKDFETLIFDTLERDGNEPLVSEGFSSLVDEIEKFTPRVLVIEVSNIGMPKFLQLSKELLHYKESYGLKIVVATNVPGYQNFLATGADIYLPKPYDLEVLLKEIRRLRFIFE